MHTKKIIMVSCDMERRTESKAKWGPIKTMTTNFKRGTWMISPNGTLQRKVGLKHWRHRNKH